MKGLCKIALVAVVVAACGGDVGITEPVAPAASPPMSGGILALGVDSTTGASIETNLDDYAPGEVVHLVGRGWASGETVNLHMVEDPNTHADVDTNVVVDAAGGFSIHFYDVQPHDLGVTFTLTATGQTSNSIAVATFTDNVPVNTFTLGGEATVMVAPNGAVNTVLSGVVNGGAGGSTLGSVAVRSYLDGASSTTSVELECVNVNPNVVHVSGAAIPWTESFSFNAPGSVGTYDVFAATYASDDCTGAPIATLTLNNGIIVQNANTAPSLTGVPTTAQSIPELALYTFDANATDSDFPAQTLTFSIVGSLPTGATFNTSTGVFEWTPTEAQGPSGPHTFTVRVSDGTADTDQLVTLNVTEVNAAPALQNVAASATIAEEVLYTFDANATDSDDPVQTLAFSLQGAPSGAVIDASTGVFTWTPDEAQGPNSYTFDVRVFDGVVHATQSITLIVSEANASPSLTGVPSTPSIPEIVNYTFDANATDGDLPAQTLVFSLVSEPAGASINSTTGAFSWTPTEAQGPGNYPFTVRVSDGVANTDVPITITVTEVNVAPELDAINNKSGNELSLISFTATASDADLPANTLTFSLGAGAPAGAAITSGGYFTWTPTEAQGPGDFSVTVRVTDNGTGNLWDEETIDIHVNEVNVAPELASIGAKSVDEGSLLTFDANATDADLPANSLTYSLDAGAPITASIDPSTGVFTWTPTNGPAQSQNITIRVTDNGTGALTDFETIAVTVNNVAPTIGTINFLSTPIAAGTNNVVVTWNFTDPGTETWKCWIEWDSGTGFVEVLYTAPKSCNATTTLPAGIYTTRVKVTDDVGNDIEDVSAFIVVYDPNGGFVTGGGWINSPAGAYGADPLLAGKATFGFTSKYLPGKNVPTGNTEFQFHAGSLNFKSTVYEWLVVAGTRAQFKGDGTINGVGGYGFLLTAIDESQDKFRIKIVKKSDGSVVYDNQQGELDDSPAATVLGGGSVVVHTKK